MRCSLLYIRKWLFHIFKKKNDLATKIPTSLIYGYIAVYFNFYYIFTIFCVNETEILSEKPVITLSFYHSPLLWCHATPPFPISPTLQTAKKNGGSSRGELRSFNFSWWIDQLSAIVISCTEWHDKFYIIRIFNWLSTGEMWLWFKRILIQL